MMFRGLGALAQAYLLETLRSKMALFWNVVFPLFFLFGFAIIFGGSDPQRVSYLVPGLMTITIISSSFFGVGMSMVAQRELGVYRRFRVTPVSAIAVVAAHSIVGFVILYVPLVLQLIVAKLVFHITIAGPLWRLAVAILLAGFAFIPLGLIIGSVARDMKTAPAITNILFFPMMFLSGAAIPFFMLPGWLQKIATLLPATYVVEILQGVMLRDQSLLGMGGAVAVLLATGLTAYLVNGLLFRWESTQPLRLSRLAVAVGALTALYLVALFAGPRFRMAEPPGGRTAANDRPREADTILLKHFTFVDPDGNAVRGARILIQDGKIARILRRTSEPDPKDAAVHDLHGGYLIPGLFDSHVHLGGSGGGYVSPVEWSASRLLRDLQTYLGVGVTAFVSLTDDMEDLLRLREMVEAGRMRAPHTFLAGASITAPGGHPAARFRFVPGLAERMTRQVESPEQARAAVRELAAKGVDLIKLVLEGGSPSQPLPKLKPEALRAAISEAKRLGLQTTVHVKTDADARLAVEAGADGLEHAPAGLSDETLRLMRERGVTLTPTLAVYEAFKKIGAGESLVDSLAQRWCDPQVLASLASPRAWFATARNSPHFGEAMVQQFRAAVASTQKAYRAGVRILAGSDAGNSGVFHGIGLIRELELLQQEAGLPPRDVFLSATRWAADRLRRGDLGRIAEGARADLVVLRRNPLQFANAYRSVVQVYFGGKRLDRNSLLTTDAGEWRPAFAR